jgi:hypothetical protein
MLCAYDKLVDTSFRSVKEVQLECRAAGAETKHH